jgi:hypothetical protein
MKNSSSASNFGYASATKGRVLRKYDSRAVFENLDTGRCNYCQHELI